MHILLVISIYNKVTYKLFICRVVIDIFQVSPIFDIDAGFKSIVDTDIDTLL